MPRYSPSTPSTFSLRELNFLPLYMYSPHVLHRTVIGNIMRTTKLGLMSAFFVRGIFDGSKSGGKYLFSTLRSPMVEAWGEVGGGGGGASGCGARGGRNYQCTVRVSG